MNLSRARLLLICALLGLFGPPSARAQSVEEEIDALTERIMAKVQAGQNTEADLARELNQISDLHAKYRTQKTAAADILLFRAVVYERFIKDREMALILYEQVATDYPGTAAAYIAGSTVEAARATADDAPPRSSNRASTPPTSGTGGSSSRPRNTVTSRPTEELTRNAPNRAGSTPSVGNAFPDFNVQDLQGAPLTVSQFRGKIVLVDFWATWCGPCVAEMDNVMAAYRKYYDKGFEIVGISLDHDRAPLVNFVRRRTITWPQHFDEGGKLASRYGIRAIPATFLLDREGKVIGVNLRGAALDRAIAKALEN